MNTLVFKLGHALRNRDASLVELARKVVSNARALASARLFLRDFDRVGERARCFGPAPHVANEGSIHAGDDFAVSSAFGAASLSTEPGGKLTIGDRVTINYGTQISAVHEIRIGHGVLVGPYCVLADSDGPSDGKEPAAIEIGDDVWLAARVVVRPGARIGAGSVIAAGSVVEGEIPPNAIASGAPARVLRIRERESETEQ